jgi:hypothetical protein
MKVRVNSSKLAEDERQVLAFNMFDRASRPSYNPSPFTAVDP